MHMNTSTTWASYLGYRRPKHRRPSLRVILLLMMRMRKVAVALLLSLQISILTGCGINACHQKTLIDYSSGFTSSGLALNGNAALNANILQLTDGGRNEKSSSWYSHQVPVTSFTTDFSFQQSDAVADGFTFTIQNIGLNALGALGRDLGYGGIGKSVAIKFDIHNNAGEGDNSIGIYSDGASPILPAVDLTGTGIDLHAGHVMKAQIAYENSTLTLSITDSVTGASTMNKFSVDIPTVIGSPIAYVGFTAGTGSLTSTQNILSWNYSYVNEGSMDFCELSPAL